MLEFSKGTLLADRYTLERPLGGGGEAEAWLAKDRLTQAAVALKIVAAGGNASERLRLEWQTNLRLMHAHIIRAFEFHEDRGAAFYSLQFIDGPDFGTLSGRSLIDVLPPLGLVADALRYAHGKDIVHRDIKASNVLLDYNGAPYLSDFGVAAPVGAPAGGGSLIAASPQVLRGEPARSSDDIFALGVLLYELVSGAPPWPASATRADIHDVLPGPLRAASQEDVPAAVQDLVARMLDMDEVQRPNAEEVGDVLRQAGFAPGPARSLATARPIIEDERVETVSAVRRPAVAPSTDSAALPAASASGMSPRAMGISLVALVVVLLGVVFLLPGSLEEKAAGPRGSTAVLPYPESTPGSSPVAGDVPNRADPLGVDRVDRDYVPENQALEGESIEFNESDADYSGLDDQAKLRYSVDMILGELLSDFETLEKRSVQRWAPVPYRRAQEYYAAGDEAYLKRDWARAEVQYLDALSLLEPLFEQVQPEFETALAGAKEAFESGDRVESLRLYELAVAITPNHPEARAGYERAANLETVLQLVDQGLDYEKELELDAAKTSFQRAVEIDPNWTPAQEGLARVEETRIKMQFDSRMSEGIESLAAGEYLAARAAFRMAKQLMPDSHEPADGLMQVDQGMRLDNINTLEREASALERSEHWDAAATTYEEILKVDGALSFAMDGLSQSRRMSALHKRLDDYIKDPDRLSNSSVMQQATTLVVDITRMPDIGPRLAGQRDELSRLLKRAATPIPVELVSDNMTSVSIYKVGVLGTFSSTQVKLRPGPYVAVGVRAGYRDVRLEFRVTPENDMQPVVVRCEEPI